MTALPHRSSISAFAAAASVGLLLGGQAEAQDPGIRSTPRIVTIQPTAPLARNQLPGASIGPSAPDLAPLQQRDLQSYGGTYEDRLRRRSPSDRPEPVPSGPTQLAPVDQQKLERYGGALDSDVRRLEMDAARGRLGAVERRSLDEARRDSDRLQGGLGRR